MLEHHSETKFPKKAAINHIDELLKSLYGKASMVEARDPYTGRHPWRASQFSRILATDIN